MHLRTKIAAAALGVAGAFGGGSAIAAWATPAQTPPSTTVPSTDAHAEPGRPAPGTEHGDDPHCPRMGGSWGSPGSSGYSTNSSDATSST